MDQTMQMSFRMLPNRMMIGTVALVAGLLLASTTEIGVPLILIGGVMTLAMPPRQTPSSSAVFV
jgi:hypothetical protein